MENIEQDKYISESKKHIDNFINKHDYRRAFDFLILFLGRLDDNKKNEVIDYYKKNMTSIRLFQEYFPQG
jgi:hypothetical protein